MIFLVLGHYNPIIFSYIFFVRTNICHTNIQIHEAHIKLSHSVNRSVSMLSLESSEELLVDSSC